jgi:hypothetical protein
VSTPGERTWLSADTALWRTTHIVSDLMQSRVPEYRVDTLFPLGPNEIALAAGAVHADAYRSAGDGSYVHSSSMAFGTGGVGVALVAGSLIGNAAVNAKRRREAEANAAATWRPEFAGSIYVTSSGFVIQTADGLFPWDWQSIDLMEVAAFNLLVLQGRSAKGAITWRLTSEWSELVFVLWALNHHPNHPQLRDGTWLPPGWIEWATHMGYRPHLAHPQIES